MRYLILIVWFELICLFAFSCSGPKEKRGDWMEHLNDRQFNFEPPMTHYTRRNYRSGEELKELWQKTYERAIADCVARGADE